MHGFSVSLDHRFRARWYWERTLLRLALWAISKVKRGDHTLGFHSRCDDTREDIRDILLLYYR